MALRVAKKRGELVDAGEIEREWTDILRVVRSGMLAIPNRIGAQLPHLPCDDVAAIERDIRAVLTELGESGGNGC